MICLMAFIQYSIPALGAGAIRYPAVAWECPRSPPIYNSFVIVFLSPFRFHTDTSREQFCIYRSVLPSCGFSPYQFWTSILYMCKASRRRRRMAECYEYSHWGWKIFCLEVPDLCLETSEPGSTGKHVLPPPTLYEIRQRCPMRQVYSQQIYDIRLSY